MNENSLYEMMKFAQLLEDSAFKCGSSSPQAAMIRDLVHEIKRLNRAIETIQGAHKIEVEKLEDHYFNGVHGRMSDGQSKNTSRDNPADHAN